MQRGFGVAAASPADTATAAAVATARAAVGGAATREPAATDVAATAAANALSNLPPTLLARQRQVIRFNKGRGSKTINIDSL